MKRYLVAALAVLSIVIFQSPANAKASEVNPNISARMVPGRYCQDDYTQYDIELINNTKRTRYFRVREVFGGKKVGDTVYRVARRSGAGVAFVVPAGRKLVVTVTWRGEVILHRRMYGICY